MAEYMKIEEFKEKFNDIVKKEFPEENIEVIAEKTEDVYIAGYYIWRNGEKYGDTFKLQTENPFTQENIDFFVKRIKKRLVVLNEPIEKSFYNIVGKINNKLAGMSKTSEEFYFLWMIQKEILLLERMIQENKK
ncbi:MAG: hypothetical protein J6Y02_17655 [Pseudobutyrivibrio sp.]|nr:hypothetical protein [Pseudobutyrivibrio sp.]